MLFKMVKLIILIVSHYVVKNLNIQTRGDEKLTEAILSYYISLWGLHS